MSAALATIEATRGRWLRFVRARVANAADAEDVLQRALLRAVARASTLEDAGRVEAWFFRILRRAIADHRRARAVEAKRRAEGDVDASEAPAAESATSDACACGARFLAELRPDYAEMIRRVDAEDAPVGEVARALRITPGNAHVRLHRARRALRARLEARCGVRTMRQALDCTDCGCGC